MTSAAAKRAAAQSAALARPWTPEVAATIDVATSHTLVPGLAFVLHATELINHYREIWAHLDPAGFEIVVAGERSEDNAQGFAEFAAANRYRATWIGDVITAGRVFDAVVSNHIGSAGSIGAHHALLLLGRRHVRLMYALGKDAWNFAPWNEEYDLILCWGPYGPAGWPSSSGRGSSRSAIRASTASSGGPNRAVTRSLAWAATRTGRPSPGCRPGRRPRRSTHSPRRSRAWATS